MLIGESKRWLKKKKKKEQKVPANAANSRQNQLYWSCLPNAFLYFPVKNEVKEEV